MSYSYGRRRNRLRKGKRGEWIHFIKNHLMDTVREQHTVPFIINTEGELQSGEHFTEPGLAT